MSLDSLLSTLMWFAMFNPPPSLSEFGSKDVQIKAWYMFDNKNIIKGKPVSQLPNGPSPGGVDWTHGLLIEQVPQAIRVVNNLNWAKY